jgi:hypothetical protein
MSMAEPLTETATCASCGSEMARGARLCHVCGSETKQWKNSLTYFAKIAGAIAIVASGATFMAGQAAIWYDRLMWHDAVKAVFFEYPGISGFLNTGSGDVVLESVMIEQPGERDSITIPVNLLVHKGEFIPFDATNPFGKPKNDNVGVWATSRDGAPTAKLLSHAIDWRNQSRCAERHFHNADHVVFQRIATLNLPQKLVIAPASAHLNFISLHTGQSSSVEVPHFQTAFMYFPGNPGCANAD